MKTEDVSKKPPEIKEVKPESKNPLKKPFQFVERLFKPKEVEDKSTHKIVHTPHINNHLLRPYLTQPAIDVFYMKVISVLEKQKALSPIQARASLTHAKISCALEGEQLKTVCCIEDGMKITFLFEKMAGGEFYSLLRSYSVNV